MLPQNYLGPMSFLSSWTSSLAFQQAGCPPLPAGDLLYDIHMGYPMNIMWDKKRCVAYVTDFYNASLSIYDPYIPKVIETVQFPGLSHAGDSAVNPLHTSGLILRPDSENPTTLEVLVDNGDAFFSEGRNVSGPDYLITMDLDTRKVIDKTHLNNGLYAGYADLELGDDGNTYVLGTYKGNVLRVTPDKEVSTFYVELPLGEPRLYGYTGITHVGHHLIVPNNVIGNLLRFDLRDKNGSPEVIKMTPYHNFTMANVLTIPEKYNKEILLMTENMTPDHPSGGVGVYRLNDPTLREIQFLGFLPNRLGTSLATSTRQLRNRIYMVALYTDGANITVSGQSSSFVLQDFTADIDALVARV